MGAEHPAVLQAGREEVVALDGLGRTTEARKLAGEILAVYEKTLGDDHPATIEARRTLGGR